jgi:hypothetical protein
MTEHLHPQVATLLTTYARDLALLSPSPSLDARVAQLVAAHAAPAMPVRARAARLPPWAAAAGVAAVAIGIAIGISVGMGLARRAAIQVLADQAVREPAWPPSDFAMWPTDSVALQIPAEYSSHGTLVAVDAQARASGTRYWVDVIVSNDGTMRIQKIVPAGVRKKESRDGVTLQ